MVEHVVQWSVLMLVRRLGQQVNNHFGVAGRLKDVAVFLILAPQQRCVDEVPIVGDGDLASCEAE